VSPGPGGSSSPPPPKVFICYRREETAAHAGRLYDAMAARFGEGNVFMDVDMAPGVDFVKQIPEVVAGCQVLIVIMGPSWATVEDEEGNIRIADPEDFVRLEVEAGLRRPDMTPIPVLVSGARMPRREDLPSGVQPITRRNALELSEGRWRYDVNRLNSTLDELLVDFSAAPKPPSAEGGADTGGAAPSEAVEVPGEAGSRSIAGATASEENRAAARRLGGGRLPRRALFGATAIAAIAVSVVLAISGGKGACGPACVIETAFTSTKPADCTKLQTARYLEQTRFKPYPVAVTRCRAAADNAANKPDSVEVSSVRESADTAIAEASPNGGLYDGQTMVLGLVKEGNQWKLDEIKKFKGFDKGAYEHAYEETAPNAIPSQTRSHARCVVEYLADRVGWTELEQAILKGENTPFARAYETC
jgi:hypothetical protein